MVLTNSYLFRYFVTPAAAGGIGPNKILLRNMWIDSSSFCRWIITAALKSQNMCKNSVRQDGSCINILIPCQPTECFRCHISLIFDTF